MTNRGLVKGVGTSNLKLDNKRIQGVATPLNTNEAASSGWINPLPVWAFANPNYVPTNLFDPRKSIYNWKGSNTRLVRRGLAYAAKGGSTNWYIVGDSASAGCNSATGTTLFDRVNAWPLAMRNALAGMGVPIGGTGIIRTVDSGSFSDARWATSGTWSNQVCYASTTLLTSTATCSPDVGGSVVEVFYLGQTLGGMFTVTINGATSGAGFTTVDTSLTTGWQVVRMPGVTVIGGQSKIKITYSASATSGIAIAGLNVYTPNGGLVVHNASQSGSFASGTGNTAWVDYSATTALGAAMQNVGGTFRSVSDAAFTLNSATMTSATANFTANDIGLVVEMPALPAAGPVIPENTYISAFTNSTTVTLSNLAYVNSSAKTINIGRVPSVVHIEIGGNDLSNGFSIPTIMTAIETIRKTYASADCILHLPQEFAYGVAVQARQDLYAAAMYQLADIMDVPLFDWRDRVGRFATATANGIYGDPAVHLVPSAYAMMGAMLAEIVGESAGKTQSFATPTADADFANKFYVDSTAMEPVNVLAPSTNGFETLPRLFSVISNQATPMTTGRLMLVPIALPKGYSIGHISFVSGTTAVSGPTHWWFAVYDSSFNQVAITSDQLTTAWAANTVKTLAVTSSVIAAGSVSFVTTYTGLHYVGIMMAASTTMPSFLGVAAPNSTLAAIAPAIVAGLSDSTQTTPPTFPHTATTVSGATIIPYAYVTN